MASGIVKWFNETKGFGFITPDAGGKDLYVNLSTVQAGGLTSLKEGERVEFEVQQGAKGPQATELKRAP
jgi:CspA family cold shock protein